jgi:hypothetical protein
MFNMQHRKTMKNQTDHAWVALQTGKTEFTEGAHLFNGCTVTISKRQEPYGYVNSNGKNATKSARYWGKIVFPNGVEKNFEEERGGAIARSTGFSVATERALYKEQGDKYILPHLR